MSRRERRYLVLSQVALLSSVAFELLIPLQIQRIIDQGVRNEDLSVIAWTSVLMLVFAAISAACGAAASWLASVVSTETVHQLRVELYDKITKLSFGDLDRFRTGPLLIRLTSDITIIRGGLSMAIVMLLRAPVMLVGALSLVAWQTPSLLIPTIVVIGVLSGIILAIVPRLGPLYAKQQGRLDDLNSVLQENLAGVQVVKNFVRQDLEVDRYTDRNQELYGAAMRPAKRTAVMEPSFLTLVYVTVAAALFVTSRAGVNGLTAGELATFLNYLLTAMLPIAFLGFVLPEVGRLASSLTRAVEVLDSEPEVQEVDATTAVPDPALDIPDIEFENVTMHYRGDDGEPSSVAILSNVSFSVASGERIVILGATGSGKTSLLNLIPRFYDVTTGTVRVRGVDVRKLPLEELRRTATITLQQAHVFGGSVARNIGMGASRDSDIDLREAAEIADAKTFISELRNGFETDIHEKGANLSGGQRQRVALARAVIGRPPILLLDDTTSAVDVGTEARIQQRLDDDLAGTTVVMVAQRVSAALRADRILLLDGGELVGNGSHAELLDSSELYREIVESQLGPLDEVAQFVAGFGGGDS